MTTPHTPACEELFDSVIQSIFGVGLQLEHCLESTDEDTTRAAIDASIRNLHDIIGRVRNRGDLRCDDFAHS